MAPRLFSDGADTIRLRARGGVVALTLAKHSPVFVVILLPPLIVALFETAWGLSIALALPALLAATVFGLVWRKALPDDLRAVEAMASVALLFLCASLLSVPAFMVLGMSPAEAMFEGMSGITTTGLSVATTSDDWPFAAHVLRSWTQWVGGLVMATAVLALVLPSGLPMRRLGKAGIDQGDRISSTRRQARQLLGVYVGLTLIAAVVLGIVIPDWREGVVLALSSVSTGGFAPRSDSLASYSALAQGLVILVCCLGAISMLSFVLLLQRKWRAAWQLGSIRRVLTATAVLITTLMMIRLALGAGIVSNLYSDALNLLSALSTAGFSTGAMPIVGPLFVLMVLAMLAGGDVGSTAGGLKLQRIGLLGRALRHAIRQPSLPDRAVAPLRHDGEKVEDRAIISILALLLIYFATLLALSFQFAAHGHPLGPALFESISALSTVGLSTGLVSADLSDDLILSLTLAMWLGRLEFIAVIVLITPRTWIKRS